MRWFRRALVALALGAVVLWLLSDSAPSVEPGSILVVDIGGSYAEEAEPPILSRLLGDGRQPLVSLLSELRKAERDDRLGAVVLRIRSLEIGWGKAHEIRNAIAALGAAGRRTLAYLEVESFQANMEYYIATGADEIHEPPATTSPLLGLAAEYFFLGGMFEKLGVEMEVERIGRYKTAADFFSAREMSDAHREMADALLDSINQQFVGGIAEGRGLSPDFVRDAIDRAPMTSEELLALGLIDQISHYDQVIELLGDGPTIRGADYAEVDPASVGFEPVAEFALVYGSGPVITGSGARTRSGRSVLASETVSSALEDAAEDDDISAIIFRIDSPGGSALASDIVWRAARRARKHGKPVIASISDVAASGGYYVASAADAIVAPPAGLTGSIGVVLLRPVFRGLLEKLGIGVQPLTRGAHADLLLGSRPLTAESRARLQDGVESIYDLFVERVADGRELSTKRVDELGQGRVWTGAQAAELGLIDEVGGLRVAVRRAKESLDLDPDSDVLLVPYPLPKSFAKQIDEALRGVAMSAVPELPLPRLVRDLSHWLAALPEGAPVLLPPFLVEIH